MGRLVYVLALVVVLFVVRSTQLRCAPCETVTCPSPYSLGCRFGIGKDVCNCCPACLKGPGESCAGSFNLKGKCAPCMECLEENGDIIDTSRGGNNPVGMCVYPYPSKDC